MVCISNFPFLEFLDREETFSMFTYLETEFTQRSQNFAFKSSVRLKMSLDLQQHLKSREVIRFN